MLLRCVGTHNYNVSFALQPLSQSGDTFDAMLLVERAVAHAVYRTILSSSGQVITREDLDKLGAEIREGAKFVMYMLMRPWLGKSDLSCRLLAPGVFKEKQRKYGVLDGVVRDALNLKERQLRGEKQPHEEWAAGSDSAKELLEHILTSEKAALIDREELVGDLKHLLLGGAETTTDLIALLMLALALTPDVQDKVHQELDEVFADPSLPVTAADLSRLRYLEMTLKEVMRYFPLIPVFARYAADDVTLPSGAVVPRGGMVVVFPKAVHWDPRWYPDPSVFNPDRHQPEVAATRPKFSYIPFSAGARGCIGQRYGMLLSKAIAASVLREYRFLPAPGGAQRLGDVKVVLGIAMHAHGGVNVRVQRRRQPA